MDVSVVQELVSGGCEDAHALLKKFLDGASKTFAFPELNENNYRRDLWRVLHEIIKDPDLRSMHADALAAVRILSRDKTLLGDVNEDLIEAIAECSSVRANQSYDDDEGSRAIVLEALKCLCNLIFNSPKVAAICCKNGTIEGIVCRLKPKRDPDVPADVKFFDVKILFLLSALRSETRAVLKDMHAVDYLLETIELVLDGSHNSSFDTGRVHLKDQEVDLVCEILKVLFNLTLQQGASDEEERTLYVRIVTILRKYLLVCAESEGKKRELVNHVVNLLTNVPDDCFAQLAENTTDGTDLPEHLRFEDHDMSAVHEMLRFLEMKFDDESEDSFDVRSQRELLSPVLSTLLKCTVGERSIRKYLRTQILPPLKDVRRRPEEGSTMRNHMCRLLTSPITQVRDLAAELLFVLCKENVNRMIKYTGYGNAAGLFATRGLLGGRSDEESVAKYSSDSDSDTEEYKQFKYAINPVVGCYEPPRPSATANMTEEQKEHEAMKLVNLMASLTETGVIKPCRIGEDGRPQPVDHILQLRESLRDDGSDSE